MDYDPSQFRGAARYYQQGRPPYSAGAIVLISHDATRPAPAATGRHPSGAP